MAINVLNLPELNKPVKYLFDLIESGSINFEGVEINIFKHSKFTVSEKDGSIFISFANKLNVKNDLLNFAIHDLVINDPKLNDIRNFLAFKKYSKDKFTIYSKKKLLFEFQYIEDSINLDFSDNQIYVSYLKLIDLEIEKLVLYRDHILIKKQGIDFKVSFNE